MTCRWVLNCPYSVLPIYGAIVGKKIGMATYYYLLEIARVDGKPKIVSEGYLGTAGELAAAMRGGRRGLPERTRHKAFGGSPRHGACWMISAWPASLMRRPGRGGRRSRCPPGPTWRWRR